MAGDEPNDGDVLMIQGACSRFWRKRNNLARHGPVQVSLNEIQLPTWGSFCRACVEPINEMDSRFVYFSLDDHPVGGL